jgi:hypothetical protein
MKYVELSLEVDLQNVNFIQMMMTLFAVLKDALELMVLT